MVLKLRFLAYWCFASCVNLGCQGTPAPASPTLVVVQVPATSPIDSWALAEEPLFPGGTRLLLHTPAALPVVLTTGFHAAAWPAVSPDATQLLFAGRRTAVDPWQIWIVDLPQGEPRLLIPDPEPSFPTHCIGPQWITADRVAMRCSQTYPALSDPEAGAIWVVAPGKQAPQRITFSLHAQQPPAVLPDGRIVYAERLVRSFGNEEQTWSGLMAVHPDGTGIYHWHSFQLEPQIKLRPRLVSPDELLYIGTGHGGLEAGRGGMYLVRLAWPSHQAIPVRPDLEGSVVAAAADGQGNLLVCTPDGAQPVYSVQRVAPTSSSPPELLLYDPAYHAADVVAVVPHPAAAPATSIVEQGLPGWLYLISPYVAEPEKGHAILPGSVGRGRILTAVPLPPKVVNPHPDPDDFLRQGPEKPFHDPHATAGGVTKEVVRRPLGEFATQEDGSFLVQVPTDQPITLQLLSPGGALVKEVGGWFWVRPNEKRGCIGCHEDPGRMPPNLPALALRRPASPFIPQDRLPPPVSNEVPSATGSNEKPPAAAGGN